MEFECLEAIPSFQSSESTRHTILPVTIKGYMLYSVESQLFMKREIGQLCMLISQQILSAGHYNFQQLFALVRCIDWCG